MANFPDNPLLSEIFPLITFFIFIFGACTGSFLNVIICRLPKGESIIHPGSHCPRCGHQITPLENIPVLSWVWLRAKCRGCGEHISARYPLVEFGLAATFTLVWLRIYHSELPISAMPALLFLTAVLFATAIIDIDYHLIPDKITVPGCFTAFLLAFIFPQGHGAATQLLIEVPDIADRTALVPLFPRAADILQLENTRMIAFVDTLSGFLFACFFLLFLRMLGNLLWGKKKFASADPQQLTVQSNVLYIGSSLVCDLAETSNISAVNSRVTASAQNLKFVCIDKTGNSKIHFLSSARVSVNENIIRIGSLKIDKERLISLTAYTKNWHIPRNVLGYGDIKLLAMVGAFLGAGAFIAIVLLASLAGLIFGGIRAIVRREKNQAVPFAPFIGGAAFIWVLYGPELFLNFQALIS